MITLDAGVRWAERRFGRYGWFRRWHHPPVMGRLVRPTRTHWSGLHLRCWRRGDDETGWLHIIVWRLSWRGIERVRATRIAPGDIIEGVDVVPVYWAPIADARGGLFLVTLHQTAADGRRRGGPIAFTWKSSAAEAIYSEPQPHGPLPRAILFSPVTQCNLNCIHCISRHSRGALAQVSDDVWAQIAAAAASGQLVHLRTDYSGDLLFADRRYGNWLRRIEELGISFSMDTHANDLTADYVARLLRSRLSDINFSLDTMDPDDYPRIRRGARPLAEVIANIERFMAGRHAQRRDIETVLSFVLMRRNLDSLHAAIDLAADLGVSGVVGNHLHAYTSDMAEESLMLEPARYARVYQTLVDRARAKGVNLGLPPPVRVRASRRGHLPCQVPWSTMAVLGNGDVMACCVPGTNVGTLRGSSLEQVWNGEAMREFRRRVNSDQPPEACNVCPMARLTNNGASYVPGLPEAERQAFERRCLEAAARGD
jgi:radical SAM protein with 4Fe4S-binding SPASM domain